MKTIANDSAFPEVITDIDPQNPTRAGDTYSYGGMSKREYFAAMALQALDIQAHVAMPAAHNLAESAVNIADALIEALNAKR